MARVSCLDHGDLLPFPCLLTNLQLAQLPRDILCDSQRELQVQDHINYADCAYPHIPAGNTIDGCSHLMQQKIHRVLQSIYVLHAFFPFHGILLNLYGCVARVCLCQYWGRWSLVEVRYGNRLSLHRF